MVRQMMAGVKPNPSQWMRLGGDPWSSRTIRMETSRQARRRKVQRTPAKRRPRKPRGRVWVARGRVAHDEDGSGVNTGAEACGVLEGIDGVPVIGVTVMDELVAGSPVGDEVASSSLFA